MGLIRHLNPLEYKAIGLLEFKIETPLHIGAGVIEARRTLVRIPGDSGFLISSSTWKGAFRSISEKLARSMELRDELAKLAVKSFREEPRVGYEVDEQFCKEVLNVLQGGTSSILPYDMKSLIELAGEVGFTAEELAEIKKRGFAARENLLYKLAESILAIHCPIGKLYGNHVIAGKLRFLDTILRPGRDGIILHERPGVAIDRCTGRAKEKNLFFLESIIGDGLKLRIIADNLAPGEEDSKLLASTVEAIMELGLSLGARKSAGMGKLKLNSEASYWYVVNLKNDKGGVMMGNPFKHAERKSLEDFVKWLQG
ncbi:MAG: RAMP superfamily CRISPR-associated protein [Candidatus Nezhaarchaeales archaeon]